MIKMNFNDIDFSRWLVITKGFTTFGGADFDVTTKDVGFNGTYFVKNRYKEKVITVPFYIEYPQLTDYDAFQRALYVTEPQKLIFSHQPYRYYYAIPTGDLDFDEFRMNGKGTLTFIVPDGVAHSTTYRRFDNGTVSSDKIVFDLVNDGNVPAIPIITVKHNAENGYIGIVNSTGAIEVGNIEEADTEEVKQSEVLFDYASDEGIIKGFADGDKNVAVLNDNTQSLDASLYIKDEFGRPHIAFGERGTGAGPNHAGSISWEIPSDSAGQSGVINEYIKWRQIFWVGAVNQYGFIKVTVSDENGQFLYGVETYKRSIGFKSEYNFLASNGNGGFNILKRWNFDATNSESDNPFSSEQGWADMKRNDDQVQVSWLGSYSVFTIPEIKDKKSAKVHVSISEVGDKPAVHHAYIDGIVYRKDFVKRTKDIPNRYSIGSNVVVDCESDSVTVDGLERITDVVHGSTFPTIPTGNSQLEVYCSSWTQNKPTVTVEFEERWL